METHKKEEILRENGWTYNHPYWESPNKTVKIPEDLLQIMSEHKLRVLIKYAEQPNTDAGGV